MVFVAGADVLAEELSTQINSQCPNMEFEHGGQMFSLDLRTITGDVDIPQNNFKTQDFNPQGRVILTRRALFPLAPNWFKWVQSFGLVSGPLEFNFFKILLNLCKFKFFILILWSLAATTSPNSNFSNFIWVLKLSIFFQDVFVSTLTSLLSSTFDLVWRKRFYLIWRRMMVSHFRWDKNNNHIILLILYGAKIKLSHTSLLWVT